MQTVSHLRSARWNVANGAHITIGSR